MKHMLRKSFLGWMIILILFTPANTVQAEITSTSFAVQEQFSAGDHPRGVAIADLDGDGLPDITVANNLGNSISVLRNTSTGGNFAFNPQVQFSVENEPSNIAIGDLDGDTRQDLAVLNTGTATVSILVNTSMIGSITFAPQVSFSMGISPLMVAIGDLDGDGLPDLMTANYLTNTVSVLRNISSIGNIAFAPLELFPVGSHPRWVAIGDLDGDGRSDLAVANSSGMSISVLRNESTGGNIAFSPEVQFSTGGQGFSVVISDLDGDMKQDLAAVLLFDHSVALLRNTSSTGTIDASSFATYTLMHGLSTPCSLTVGDLDSDAKPDLVTSNLGDSTVSVLGNTSLSGSISFTAPFNFSVGGYDYFNAIGDLDGDSRPEIAASAEETGAVSILRNVIGLDIIPPITTITIHPANPSNVPSPSFSFTSNETDSTFTCKVDNGIFSACASPTVYNDLSDGSHTFQVRAKDLSENVDPTPAEYTWVINTVAPDTAIQSFPPLATNSSDASFTFSSPDTSAVFECKLDSSEYTTCANPQTYSSLSFGSHIFKVRAMDLAGNVDPSPAQYLWKVDPSPICQDINLTTDEDTSGFTTPACSDVGGTEISYSVSSAANGATFVAAGLLQYTPNLNYNGSDSFTYTANDGTSNSQPVVVNILVMAVNDVPSFTAGANQSVLEDAGAQTVNGWATALSAGPANENGQTLNFLISNDNNGLFSVQPAVSPTGVLTYTPASNANGSATVTVRIHDNGGTANGGVDTSAAQTFTITVTAVNDVPSFTAGANQSVLEDVGAQTVSGWATALSAGPANESGQTLDFLVSNNNNTLFSVQPAVSPTGVLAYTPAANANGLATVSVRIHDNGGTTNGGVDTSATQTFTITVTAVNDVPSFTAGANQSVLEDAGAQTVNGWATALSAGPANESGQVLNFLISNDNNGLFSVQPAVSPTGVLTYTPAANANGLATVSVRIHDNGGTANGGVDTSVTQTFTITVTAVNDVPSFTAGANQSVPEDAGAQTVSGWATALSAGPANESGQALNFLISNDNNGLFSVQPAVSPTGVLTYTPASNANGSATVTVRIHDNGGTANGGVDTSVTQTFTITVTPVNDAPVCQNVILNTDEDTVGTTAPNCADVDGDGLTYAVASQPANGAAAVVLNLLQYTPNLNYNGPDSFTYTSNDGSVNSAPAAVTVSVGSANDLPTAVNDTAVTDEDTAVAIDVLANDSDTDGGTLSVVSVTTPAHGTAVIENGQVTYTPSLNYNGPDSFTYTLSDGQSGTAEALVTVTVAPVNDAPVGAADAYETVFMTALTVSPAGVLSNDSDVEGDDLSAVLVANVIHGTLTLNPDGSFTYTPNVGYFGPDSFTYRCSDGTAQSQEITVNITVNAYSLYLPFVRR